MVPTEILAEQHFRTISRWLSATRFRVALLTGGTTAAERRELMPAIERGDVHLVVGTHALVQEHVKFRALALTIVDEQHRFGVLQRGTLAAKGLHPDVLVMTATPIPRTLALTECGDMEISVIRGLPPGRRPVRTLVKPDSRRDDVYALVREQLREGRQAYVIYPLVEESEKIDLKAATEMAGQLATHVFPEFKVALLHGRMKGDEKDRVMRAFAAGEIDLLASTTVVEVGVDVPNASVMVVEHAERFGLSQLHQLRGRIGRGPWKSYCILLTSGRLGEDAQRRIDAMVQTSDGFRIAEADLELRGPGEFFGTRQSGLPELRVADLVRDAALLGEARSEAQAIVAGDPNLDRVEHRGLRQALLARWRGKLGLAGVG
jgi:ATP-dependent DNA helicase RecG